MFSQIKKITKMAKKEVINKVITSLFIQGLALVIPVFWSKTITEVTDANYKVGYYLIIITLLLSLFYYLWSYLNQKTWYTLYNKIYIEYTNATISETKNINKINLGEYTNILNNDIDIIIGVASGYVGNTITYGSNGYPNGTKITSTYNSSDITNSCASKIDTSGTDCTKKIVNGHLITYCPVEDVELQEDPTGANRPVLAEGMIPITYDGNNWVKADEYGAYNNWYDYGNQKWANAVMVTSTKRETYMNANAGTAIPENDILAYFVWIPRYKYKLFNATYASGTSAQVIDVTFENETSSTGTVTCTYDTSGNETCQNKSNGNWYTHPAFTFGDTELKGIWVGKFETTGSGMENTTITPTVKPGVASLRNITIATMYSASKLIRSTDYLTTNGANESDSHMMKIIEWGAVAYLKQSIYGLGITDIGVNRNGYPGGGTGTSYKTNIGQSTSGNITGVYDMSGGKNEYVMGNYNKKAGSSGLNVSGVPAEHIDIYSGTSVAASHLGDATGETAGWYSDVAAFVYSSNPWFARGGHDNYADSAGVFYFLYGTGEVSSYYGFRVVLSVTE